MFSHRDGSLEMMAGLNLKHSDSKKGAVCASSSVPKSGLIEQQRLINQSDSGICLINQSEILKVLIQSD